MLLGFTLASCISVWDSDDYLRGTPRGNRKKSYAGSLRTGRLSTADVNSHMPCHAIPMPRPCRAVPWTWEVAFRTAWSEHGGGAVWAWHGMCESNRPHCENQMGKTQSKPLATRHGHGMVCVNQTRPHCVNQMGKTQSKPLATRHVMCVLTLNAFITVLCIKAGSMSRTKPVQCIEDGNGGLLLVPINEDKLCLFLPSPLISDLNTQRCEKLKFQKRNAL